MGQLGCAANYQVVIASKDGVTLGQVDASSVDWGRVVDGISAATVVIPIADAACCDILGQVHTRHYEIQVFRAGTYVWSGIVVDVVGGRRDVTISAQDIGVLLNERIIHDPLCFGAACGGAPADLTDLGTAIIGNALEVDGHHYLIESAPTGLLGERLYSPGENAWSTLQEALSLGLDMTILGRKIILGAANGSAPFGTTATLTCDDFLGDLQVREDGLSVVTRAICVGNGFIGIAVAPGADVNGDHPYYGLVEYTVQGSSNLASQSDVDFVAAQVLGARFPPPVTLVIPGGSQLAPTAPVDINDLVPGALTTVIADCLCRPLTSTQVLTKLDVHWDSSGETVQVTYATPYSINSGEFN